MIEERNQLAISLQLVHKSDIFSSPIWYIGEVYSGPSPFVRDKGMKIVTFRLKNQENGNVVNLDLEQLNREFLVVGYSYSDPSSKIEVDSKINTSYSDGLKEALDELRAYRDKLLIGSMSGTFEGTPNERAASAVEVANKICNLIFLEKFSKSFTLKMK